MENCSCVAFSRRRKWPTAVHARPPHSITRGTRAAKEAVLKAMGTGWIRGISWQDVEVRHRAGGQPTIAMAGGAREICEKRGIREVLISISHCRSHATAYALALGHSPDETDEYRP